MSSLDSVLNSLSATTMEDFVRRFYGHKVNQKELFYSRLITTCWGAITLCMAFFVDDIAPTVLEAINKIGSLGNGPILAVFALGFLTKTTKGIHAIIGLITGMIVNGLFWIMLPSVSWLWWNVIGFAITFFLGLLLSRFTVKSISTPSSALLLEQSVNFFLASEAKINWYQRSAWLIVWFVTLLATLLFL